MKTIILSMISLYQKTIPPRRGPVCRFSPSCSAYTAQAVKEYGVGRGLLLGTQRILRCHPLSRGGFDPVPVKSKR